MDGVASSIWDCSAGFAARRGLRACGNPDQPPRSPALGKEDGPPRYSAPDVSPADPCNKMSPVRCTIYMAPTLLGSACSGTTASA